MKMRLGLILAILCCGLSCKQNPTVKNFQTSVAPSTPIVISSGFSQSSTDSTTGTVTTTTIAPAWTTFTLTMTNNNTGAGNEITISEIDFEGTATDKTGATVQISSTFGTANLVPPPVADSSTGITQTWIADVKPYTGPGDVANVVNLQVYIQNLPCNVSSYDFSLTATLVGWVGSPTQPTKDFQKIISIETTGTPLESGTCPTN